MPVPRKRSREELLADRRSPDPKKKRTPSSLRQMAKAAAPPPLIPPQPIRERCCLKCRLNFQSTGDRICGPCTEENDKAAWRIGARGGKRQSGGSRTEY